MKETKRTIRRKLLYLHENSPWLRSDDCDIAERQIDPYSSLSYIPTSLADETNVDSASKVDKCRHPIRFPGMLTSEESKPENTRHHESLATNDRQESKKFLVDSVTPEFSVPVEIGRDKRVSRPILLV